MNKIQFVSIGYWDKKTMKAEDSPTPEQWAQVDKICKGLTEKYYTDIACPLHPDKVQKLVVRLGNGLLDIQIVPTDTCRCHDAMLQLAKIRDYEVLMYNQGKQS